MDTERRITIEERPQIPWLSIVLGYGPMLPFVLGAFGAWAFGGALRVETIVATLVWGGSILAFLAGVRRGLSFRTEGGPAVAQIVTMFSIYVLAAWSLWSMQHGAFLMAAATQTLGYAALFVLDPIAARDGQAPLFFARLRRPQLTFAVLSLVAVAWRTYGLA